MDITTRFPYIVQGAHLIHAIRNIYPYDLPRTKPGIRKQWITFKCEVVSISEKTVTIKLINRYGKAGIKRGVKAETLKPIDWSPPDEDTITSLVDRRSNRVVIHNRSNEGATQCSK